jgi:hypothetical protein
VPSILFRNLFDPSAPMPKLMLSFLVIETRRVGDDVGDGWVGEPTVVSGFSARGGIDTVSEGSVT